MAIHSMEEIVNAHLLKAIDESMRNFFGGVAPSHRVEEVKVSMYRLSESFGDDKGIVIRVRLRERMGGLKFEADSSHEKEPVVEFDSRNPMLLDPPEDFGDY